MSIFKKKRGTGALLDIRPTWEKEKDYKLEEIVTTINPVNWVEKTEWRKFPIFNQNGSGSCVAQTMAKLIGVLYWLKNNYYVHFSATHIYQRRSNKPGQGMMGVEAFNIAREGVTLEELAPSQSLTDEQMDGLKIESYKEEVGKIFKIGNFVTLPVMDIDTIASVIQTTKKAVMVWFYFMGSEWTNEPEIKFPNLKVDDLGVGRHSVTAVDFTIYKGKKCLIIEDSWGSSYGLAGQRIITEDFFKARNWFAAYPIGFKFDEATDPNKPKYTFKNILKYSSVFFVNQDVKALQSILKYEGLFPSNVDCTGYYGSITSRAVGDFRVKYNLPGKATVVDGPVIEKLNEIYS
jgi:hypothetical protein